MIPANFEYVRAKSVAEALRALGTSGTKVIAGGQSLIPLLRFRLAQPKRVVDIGAVPQLRGIKKEKQAFSIGAATTYRELLDSRALCKAFPLLAELTQGVGDVQVRNLGTIGGGLAHADPASDMPAAMIALDAMFVLRSRAGIRKVPARKFFRGAFTTALRSRELLTTVTIPNLPKGAGTAYVSFDQAASGYALVGAAAVVARSNGVVSHAALAYTGIGEMAFLAPAAQRLVGTKGEPKLLESVAREAVAAIEYVNDDIHAPEDYRRHLGVLAGRRALQAALDRAG